MKTYERNSWPAATYKGRETTTFGGHGPVPAADVNSCRRIIQSIFCTTTVSNIAESAKLVPNRLKPEQTASESETARI
jgi:hypothetical protein